MPEPPLGLRPYVKPGEPLGFRQRLEAANKWPPPKRVRAGPTLTPYLVVPAYEGDTGDDPTRRREARKAGDAVVIENFWGVRMAPVSAGVWSIICYVRNLGPMASYGGLAVFYTGQVPHSSPGEVKLPTEWNVLGYGGFTAAPGALIEVQCPHTWAGTLPIGVLVQAYDPFIDPITSAFDPFNDRHVGVSLEPPPVVNVP